MLVAAIFIILVISTLAAYILRKRQVTLPRVWMLMAAVGVLIWLIFMVIPHGGTIRFAINNWFSTENTTISLHIAINPINWPIVFAILTLHIAFLLVSGSRQELDQDFIFWILEAAEIALAYFVITAADLWTIIIAWTAMDIGNLIYELFLRKGVTITRVITPMFFKLSGSLLLIYATAVSSGSSQVVMIENIPASSSGMFFAAAVLHSGVLPFRLPEKAKKGIETVTNLLFYLVPFISSLSLVVYLPNQEVPFFAFLLISSLSIIGMYYFGLLWIQSKQEIDAIYYLSLAFVAFAVFRFATGTHQDLVPWLVLTLLGSGWLMLFSHRGKSTRLLPVFLIISMLGIPFSLTSYGSSLYFAEGFKFSVIFVLFFHVLYLLGFIDYFTRKKELFEDMESSSQLNYLIAIVFSVFAILVISYRLAGSLLNEISNWWAGAAIISVAAGYLFWKRRQRANTTETNLDIEQSKINQRMEGILSFEWLFKVIAVLTEKSRPFVRGFSNLMEGEGGILWSLVFMALLVTLLRAG
jgi:hypothetical protein